MKSYTDIEQSKVLTKILPLESADYFWVVDVNIVVTTPYVTNVNGEKCVPAVDNTIPCWSLAALLGVIKPINENTYTIRGTLDGGAIISFDEITNIMFQEEEIINAAFKLVCWLLENEKL